MYNLITGQVLITTTNEKVTIVEIKGDMIMVKYRGKIYSRPKTIVGEKLFLTAQEQKKFEDSTNHTKNSVKTENTKKKKYVIDVLIETCKDCTLYKREDCFGEESICSQFKSSPRVGSWKY